MGYRVDELPEIGPELRARMQGVGIRTTGELLEACATPEGRERVAKKTGVPPERLLAWARLADLMRVSGVGRQFAELLDAIGVHTVRELQTRDPDALAEALGSTNNRLRLAGTSPPRSAVNDWIVQARRFPLKIRA